MYDARFALARVRTAKLLTSRRGMCRGVGEGRSGE
jgi:hypothetical protein